MKKWKHVWLSGRLHIEGRLNEGPRLQRKHKDQENEAKQNKRNTRERRHDICKPNARMIQVRATCGYSNQQGRANQDEPAFVVDWFSGQYTTVDHYFLFPGRRLRRPSFMGIGFGSGTLLDFLVLFADRTAGHFLGRSLLSAFPAYLRFPV